MEFEWDEDLQPWAYGCKLETKRQSNILKHKIDFAEAVAIFDGDYYYMYQDLRADYGEKRYVSIELLQGIETAVIHTPRNNKDRIISARRARVKERKLYYDKINNRTN